MNDIYEASDRPRRLGQLLRRLDVLGFLNPADPAVLALTCDSRQVERGTLFVAVKGAQANGHRYIAAAVGSGAAAVVCEELPAPLPPCPVVQVADTHYALSALADSFYGHPSAPLRMAGITGTDGKTSTMEILREILAEAGREAGSIGTLGYCFGGHRVDSDLTTPDAVSLHATLGRMWQAGVTDVCMEASSHSLVQHRVAHVAFDVAILTNITSDHLDTHRTREAYARAKRMLFEALSSQAVAVLPARSQFRASFQAACRGPVLTYSVGGAADVTGRVLRHGMDGMEIEVRNPFETYRARTCLTGAYNCENILAAATAAFAYGISGDVIQRALSAFPGVPGRLERISVPDRSDLPVVLVDFAHTPGALEKVLRTLRPLVRGRLVCAVGCGGDRDTTKRPVMGRIATDLADVAVFTADNSRSERTEDIIAQIVAGVGPDGREHRVEPDRRRAIALAIELAGGPDSLAVICGRGCEKYQKLGGQKIPFDDRIVTREIMAGMRAMQRRSA